MAHYLLVIKEKYLRVALTKMRLGSHNLMVERGRWEKPKKDFGNRLCDICNEIEDEFHVIFHCSRFIDLRNQYIDESLVQNPNMYTLVKLIDIKDESSLRKLGTFFHKIFKVYDSSVL